MTESNTIAKLTADQASVYAALPFESFAVIESTLSEAAIEQVETARMLKVLTHLEKAGTLVSEQGREPVEFAKQAEVFVKLLPAFSKACATILKSETMTDTRGGGSKSVTKRDSKMFPTAVGGMRIQLQKTNNPDA